MQVKRLKIADLKKAGYNPESRVSEKSILSLAKSITKVGLIYPISVSTTNKVIDGHRRLAAAELLGWEEIPCLVTATENEDEVYAEVNANTQKLGGAQSIQVWLKNPHAVTPRTATFLENMQDQVGLALIKKLAQSGFSMTPIRILNKLARYTEDNDPKFLKEALAWMIRWRNTGIVRSYMRMQLPAHELHKAIKSGKNLRVVYHA